MSEENRELTKVVSPMLPTLATNIVVGLVGAAITLTLANYRIGQAEIRISATNERVEELAKETREADKQIVNAVTAQLDDVKKALYRIEGKLEAR